MNISTKLDGLHRWARGNLWMMLFSIACRILLAFAFLAAGIPKIIGERFTVLTVMHPMGHFLDAFYRTGYYYTFVGIMQVISALLLLIPRTSILGAIIYFPIILNICILSLSVRFEGSLITSPLMVLACLYLFFWDYHKLKYILPLKHQLALEQFPKWRNKSRKFPYLPTIAIFATMSLVVFAVVKSYNIYPKNTIKDCRYQCEDAENPEACYVFCDCIHKNGSSLRDCLGEFEN